MYNLLLVLFLWRTLIYSASVNEVENKIHCSPKEILGSCFLNKTHDHNFFILR